MDMLTMPPLEDYRGNATADTAAHKKKKNRKKKRKKKSKKLKKELNKYINKVEKSKAELKAERKLNAERERRYRAEAALKYFEAMFQFYARSGAPLPELPDPSIAYVQEEVQEP